jgi:hypothetical protein
VGVGGAGSTAGAAATSSSTGGRASGTDVGSPVDNAKVQHPPAWVSAARPVPRRLLVRIDARAGFPLRAILWVERSLDVIDNPAAHVHHH